MCPGLGTQDAGYGTTVVLQKSMGGRPVDQSKDYCRRINPAQRRRAWEACGVL